jgi:hypothetical protein
MTPATLDECFPALDEMLCQEDKDYLLNTPDTKQVLARLHHSLGRHLRNKWGLWGSSPLAQNLREQHGVSHPDDMSHHILNSYIDRLNSDS